MMATYNDFFNTDKKIQSTTKLNPGSKKLKEQILKSVKKVIEEDIKNNKQK